jgi:hypothetical protein
MAAALALVVEQEAAALQYPVRARGTTLGRGVVGGSQRHSERTTVSEVTSGSPAWRNSRGITRGLYVRGRSS